MTTQDKASQMAGTAVRGGYNAFWGLSISTIIAAVGVIILARILTPADYGLMTIALVAPTFMATFRDWGVNSAMIKYVAQFRSEGRPDLVHSVIISGFLFELILGALLSALVFLLSSILAGLFKNPTLTPLIQIGSLYVFANAVLTAAQSAFVGYERMELNSFMQIFLSIIKAILAPLLVLIGFGVFGAVLGNAICFLIAGVFGMLLLYLVTRRETSPARDGGVRVIETVKMMFKYGFPLWVAATLTSFLTLFYLFLAAIYVSSALIGNYQVAVNFSILITFFSAPIATVLFPAFSKLRGERDAATLRRGFRLSVKFAAFLVVPTAVGFVVLAEPIVSTLFGSRYSSAPLFLALLAVGSLTSAIGGLSINNIFSGQGRTDINLRIALITLVIGLPLGLLLIPIYGIVGLIIAPLIASLPSLLVGLFWVRRLYGATIEWGSSARILVASGIAGAATYLVDPFLTSLSLVRLLAGAVIFLVIYVAAAPRLGAISRADTQNLRGILKGLGPLSGLVNPLLALVDKLAAV
jgi:stage V sporulation protein B